MRERLARERSRQNHAGGNGQARSAFLVGVLVTCALIAGACTGTARDDREQAVRQELVVGASEDGWQVNPPNDANVAMRNPNAPVFETLVATAPDFTLQPLLATSWELIGPSTWRFHLRNGVKFHNGQTLNAAALVDTVNNRWGAARNSLGIGKESAKIIDELTVDITPAPPNFRLVEQLAHSSRGIVAPGTYPGPGMAPDSTPTGTGPFRFVRYTKAQELVVERFDGYWGEKPRLDRVTFRFLPDDNSRILALKAGEVDAIYDVIREQASELERDPNLKTARSTVGVYSALLVNHHGTAPHDILNDIQVRRAVAQGIDKTPIVRTAWRGNAEVMQTVIPANVLGSEARLVQGHSYEPRKAASMLDAAGWTLGPNGIRTKDGRSLELALAVYSPEDQGPMPELVQAQLKQIGVDVKVVVPGDSNIYFDMLRQGQGDLFASVGNQEDANPFFLGSLFTAVQPGGVAMYGARFGAGPEYDEVFRKGYASPNSRDARHLAAQAMRIAIDETVSAIPIAGIYRIWAMSKKVEGFKPHPSSSTQKWDSVFISEKIRN